MTFEDLRPEQIPQHVAIILDGNGRWAKANGKLRSQGHKAGADNVETINDALTEMGAKYLTVYAFSTENWKRTEDEVSYLMSLMKRYLIRNKKDAIERRTRIRVIGDKERLAPDLQELRGLQPDVLKDQLGRLMLLDVLQDRLQTLVAADRVRAGGRAGQAEQKNKQDCQDSP